MKEKPAGRGQFLGAPERHSVLSAVLDAVNDGIVFRDDQGIVRVINSRTAALFDIEVDSFLGKPVVELLRALARRTEDPEGFMELFQTLLDAPRAELRDEIEQITPARRRLKLSSSPTIDDAGGVTGRVDVFTDVTDASKRAVEIQRLYEEARKTAEAYQRALLPARSPSVPRFSFVAHYIPATQAERRAVRGDFYDFPPIPDGRIGLLIGDVSGTGPQAASDAALARYTVRSLVARPFDDLVSLVTELNRLVRAQAGGERFIRIFMALLDPERASLEYVNAGHVPPILYRSRDMDTEWLGEGGLPLGVDEDAGLKSSNIELAQGDMLVLYTDGLTEAIRHRRPFGQGRLTDLVRQYGPGTPGELVQALRRSLDAWTLDLRDDVAIVAAQVVPDRRLAEPVRELVLPNETDSVPEIRDFVAHFLIDIRVPVDTSYEILIAVGEAAANASRHGRREKGRSEVRIRCALSGTRVWVIVADDGPGFDPARLADAGLPDRYASGGRGLFLMRELMDSVDVQSSPTGTTVTLIREAFG